VSCVQRVFGHMSEAQRVGQLFIVGMENDQFGQAEAAATLSEHFGSWTFIVTTTMGSSGVAAVTAAARVAATKPATRGVKPYVAVNQEGGKIQALQGPGFVIIPPATQQGLLSPSVLRADAKTWGRELAGAGVNMNFAPVLDVVAPGTDSQNQPIAVLMRGYGHDPSTVASHGLAFLHGMEDAGVTPVAKHFPGLGRVLGNTDFTANVVDKVTTPNDPYLDPFRQAVKDHVPFVMIAEATYTKIDPSHLAVFSPVVMKLLRTTMGFAGVIVSDDLGAATAVASVPASDRAVEFLQAGGDMVISKTIPPAVEMYQGVLSKAGSDDAFRSKVDAAAMKVLEAKDADGLLPCST
jgi:beta-N-acetylhexosaminidase